MFEVTMVNGRSELVPFTETAIAGVDIANRTLTIHPIKGLFDHDPQADEEERRKEEQEEPKEGDDTKP